MTAEPALERPSGDPLELEALARERLERQVYDYYAGAAGDESTIRRNILAFDEVTLSPRALAGFESVDLTTPVVGGDLAAPVLVAPMALQGMCHPEAEAAGAYAAARLGLGFCRSMFASAPSERVADASREGAGAGRAVRWAQLYLLRDAGLTRHVADEAVADGYDALVVTVDVPRVGRRSRDRASGFDRFARERPALAGSRWFREHLAAVRERDPGCSERVAIDRQFPNPVAGWPDLEALAAHARLPVLVKGVLHPGDARRSIDAGVAGVVVSNHGGRQFDRCVPSARALPAVVEAVGGRVPVYVDSGIRRSSHVAAALALGADAVLVGRPVLWGLAVAGRDGVAAVLRRLVEDLEADLAVAGCRRPADLRGCLPPSPAPGAGPR